MALGGSAETRDDGPEGRVVPLPARRPVNPSARREAFLKHFDETVDASGQQALTSDGYEAHRVVAGLNEVARGNTPPAAPEPRSRRPLFVAAAAVVVAVVVVVAVLVAAR